MVPNPELARSAFDVLVLVTSSGSGDALSVVMAGLPDLPPVALLLGQQVGSDDALQELLSCQPRCPARWAQNGTLLEAGYLYVGLPQTVLEVGPSHRFSVKLLQGEGQSNQPLDRLLTSLASSYGSRVLAVVLAGESADGTIGARAIFDAGGTVVVQHPETAACADLPNAVIEAGAADLVVPLYDLGRVVTELLTGKSTLPSMTTDKRAPPSRRDHAEEALRESELRCELAIDAAGLGTYVWYVQEDRPETDVRLLELLGVQGVGEASFANLTANVIHLDDRDRYAAAVTRALDPDGDGKFATEARFVRPGGAAKWIALTGQTVFEGEPRQAARMYGTVADITERRRAEERQVFLLELSDALRTEPDADGVANRALGLLMEHLRLDRCYIGVYRLDEDRGDLTHQVGNDRVPPVPSRVRLSDFPDALRVSFTSTLVIDDVARDERLSEVDRQNLGGLGMGALVAAALRKGEHRPLWSIVAVSASPRQWTSGETALIEEVAERTWAATVRVHAENAVRTSQERFSAVANLVPDLLWESEPDGDTTWYNTRWLEYTGQSVEQAIVLGWVDAIHPEDRDASARRYQEAVTARQPLRQEHRIRRHDGEYRWFAVDTVPIMDKRGQVVRIYGSATDIHDLRTMNTVLEARVEDRTQRLTDLNSELRTLATASSEEINEPLRRLRGFLHLLEGRVAEHLDDKTRRYFDLVQGEAVRAERLAEDFKVLGYLEHRDLKPVQVPLVTLVLQVRTDLAPRLVRQTAAWSVGPLPVVTGDAMLLRQAFTELLYHSLKLVPEGTRAQVEVNASSADSRVTVLVEVSPVKAGAADLRGDGLAIARRVMQRHGGTLETELQGERLQILLQLPDQSG